MTDCTENDLRAALKALDDVIAPSIDAADPLAGEQLRLVVEYLAFLKSRIEFIADRDRFELAHNIALSRALAADAGKIDAGLAVQLEAAGDMARSVFETAGSGSAAMKRSAAMLAALIRELVRKAQHADVDARTRIERTVLDVSGARIEFERAWFLPLGLDPAPAEVEPLEIAIRRAGLRPA
ncbi:MAG: hypothetical protein AB7O39_00375 [Flavobacteriaceae bacterium]